MKVLVINSGSSSIKFSAFAVENTKYYSDPRCLFDGELNGVGGDAVLHESACGDLKATHLKVTAETFLQAIRVVLDVVCKSPAGTVDAVGYRVVHPGAKLREHQRITEEVLRDLEDAAEFAPLHDPEVLTVIREGMARFPHIAHYVCFDTVFHKTMPEEATTYPVPQRYREQGARRYGFHGLSCESIVRRLQMRTRDEDLGFPQRMVIAHLGGGCSVTALLGGRSVDTTMGLTPTGGVVMGTRPGDLDPGLMLYMLRQQEGDAKSAIASMEAALNHASGIAGISGMTGNVKAVREAAEKGDTQATLAMKVFTRSVTKAIGGFCWLLGGLDAIVFTGGIGEHDPLTRAEILGGLQGLGVAIDERPNRAKAPALRRIGVATSAVTVFVIPSQEDLMIASHVARMTQLKSTNDR